jgi:hypothetical protein
LKYSGESLKKAQCAFITANAFEKDSENINLSHRQSVKYQPDKYQAESVGMAGFSVTSADCYEN